jgi:hypothetical protein
MDQNRDVPGHINNIRTINVPIVYMAGGAMILMLAN